MPTLFRWLFICWHYIALKIEDSKGKDYKKESTIKTEDIGPRGKDLSEIYNGYW